MMKYMNGTILKALSVFGAVMLMIVVLAGVNWFVIQLGFTPDDILKVVVSLITIFFGGGVVARYASGKEIVTKEKNK